MRRACTEAHAMHVPRTVHHAHLSRASSGVRGAKHRLLPQGQGRADRVPRALVRRMVHMHGAHARCTCTLRSLTMHGVQMHTQLTQGWGGGRTLALRTPELRRRGIRGLWWALARRAWCGRGAGRAVRTRTVRAQARLRGGGGQHVGAGGAPAQGPDSGGHPPSQPGHHAPYALALSHVSSSPSLLLSSHLSSFPARGASSCSHSSNPTPPAPASSLLLYTSSAGLRGGDRRGRAYLGWGAARGLSAPPPLLACACIFRSSLKCQCGRRNGIYRKASL